MTANFGLCYANSWYHFPKIDHFHSVLSEQIYSSDITDSGYTSGTHKYSTGTTCWAQELERDETEILVPRLLANLNSHNVSG